MTASAGAVTNAIAPDTTTSNARLIVASKPLNEAEDISRSGW